jgi:hypothetical protein
VTNKPRLPWIAALLTILTHDRGDPQLQVKIEEIHATLEHLDHAEKDFKDCSRWLDKTEQIFNRFRLIIMYSTYDRLWQMVHKIRHILCRIASPRDLLPVVADIRGCLSYIAKEKRKQYEDDLGENEKSILIHLSSQKLNDHAKVSSLAEIRFNLERLSLITADARDTLWRKVNLLRTRLLLTAFILILLLLGSLWCVPKFLSIPNVSNVTSMFILTIIGFGAMGGFVSALLNMESLEAPSYAYYSRVEP